MPREINAYPGESVQVKCRLKYNLANVAQLPKKYESAVYHHDNERSLGIAEYIKINPPSTVVTQEDQNVAFMVNLLEDLGRHSMVSLSGPLPLKLTLEYQGPEGSGGVHELGTIFVYPKPK